MEPGRLFLEIELFVIFRGKWIRFLGGEALSGAANTGLELTKAVQTGLESTGRQGGDVGPPHVVLSLACFSGKPGFALTCP